MVAGVAVLAAGAGGYGFGRYATPAKVEVRTEIKTVTQVEWRDRDVVRRVEGPTRTVTVTRVVEVEVPCPPGGSVPGTSTTTTTTTDAGPVTVDTNHASDGTLASAGTAATATTTTMEAPRWLVQAGIASGSDLVPTYNVGASYRLAGPLWLGASYHTTHALELRASFAF